MLLPTIRYFDETLPEMTSKPGFEYSFFAAQVSRVVGYATALQLNDEEKEEKETRQRHASRRSTLLR